MKRGGVVWGASLGLMGLAREIGTSRSSAPRVLE